jgi:hypothetical protein
MRVLAAVTFNEVLRRFYQEHALDRAHEANSNGEAERHLRNADAMLHQWSRVLMGRRDVLGVMLPWHLSEGGDRELIPKSGLTVAAAARRLRSVGRQHARMNPTCSAKLAWQSRSPLTPLFLSTHAIGTVDYEKLQVKDGLTHLDGLHRMLAWELHNRLPDDDQVEAYVAGALPLDRPRDVDLPAADVGHRARHHRDELHVHGDGQVRHRDDRVSDMTDVHGRLDLERAIGLLDGGLSPPDRRHVTDVDLATRDVVLAAVQRQRPGQPRHRVLGRSEGNRVWPRDVGRRGTIVDNSTTAR